MRDGKRRLRVSIDTNVFVSSVMSRTGPAYAIVASILRSELDLVVSRFQHVEIGNVLRRQKLQRFFRVQDDRLPFSTS